jgi:hypothetical protein
MQRQDDDANLGWPGKSHRVPAMRNTGRSGSREEIAIRARLRSWRRVRRLDAAVASTLLLLLIFGWVVGWAPSEVWSRGLFQSASGSPHA